MSMRRLNILLIRHGESEANVDLSMYKEKHDCQINLTATGILQAVETGKFVNDFLKHNDWGTTRFFASSYNRAQQTLENIIAQLDSCIYPDKENIRFDNRLRECEFGDIDGFTDEQIRQSFPLFFERMNRDHQSNAKYFTRHPSGESPADVGDRCRSFFGALTRDYDTHGIRNFVIIAHGITIRAFMQELIYSGHYEWYAKQKNPKNASVYLIQNKEASNKFFLADNTQERPNDIEQREGCIFIPKSAQ